MSTIKLSKQQKQVIDHRGGPVQVIACAGSGKTESVARRVAALVNEGAPPESIVAFTFTERAAAELQDRIQRRVADVRGPEYLARLAPLFVGTIHSYCFRLLQTYVPEYGNYDVVDENRHAGLLAREYRRLGIDRTGCGHGKWKSIAAFAWTADVIGNELIDPADLEGTELGTCYASYLDTLDRYRVLTFGMIISRTVEMLRRPEVHRRVHAPLRHLIVDEYQDINPAQEALIRLLAEKPVELCVVGDDDQSIYQWRGSDVSNILGFTRRYRRAEPIRLETNRRSRPEIVRAANRFAQTIPQRLEKAMRPVREASAHQVVTWSAANPEEEAEKIAETIERLHKQGYRYQDIGVLFRSVRTSAPVLIEALEKRGIPSSCKGRTGLFLHPEINLFGEIHAWFVDLEWKDERYGPSREASLDNIVQGLSRQFGRKRGEFPGLRKYLEDWKSYRLRGTRPVSIVGDFYRLLRFLGAHELNPDDPRSSARLGAYARFSELLADFEHVTRRGRTVDEDGKRVYTPGRDRGKEYYRSLYGYLLHYARDAYEDFGGEDEQEVDAVDIVTVHRAKGLEWPVVFLPALSSRRFPAARSGQPKDWHLPDGVLSDDTRRRYEGGDPEERRLFYVAMTRAKEILYLSHFEKMKNRAKPSPYLEEVAESNGGIRSLKRLPLPPKPEKALDPEAPPLEISFSDVLGYEECAHRYRLSAHFGFQQELATELGYGRAIHHILRRIAETARETGKIPTAREVRALLEEDFYLPFARTPEYKRMHAAADRLVKRYLADYADDLRRVWETERPFRLLLPEGSLSGRADVILDEEDGSPGRLAIVDYKTSADPDRDDEYRLQVGIYAEAARGEGLNVVAGYVHELKHGTRRAVEVGEGKSAEGVERVTRAIRAIRRGEFPPRPDEERCACCDFRLICAHGKAPDEG
ncbi:MAG: ATP-dependent helicase [Candidatus Eisenbacteria bacterium]|nr:ATP-dependent helicase [Candidatus Eisenbacteria bacterium]